MKGTTFTYIHGEYKKGCEFLKTTYRDMLVKEAGSSTLNPAQKLAKVFLSIASSNIELAEKCIAELQLQYYNDAAVACQYALKISRDDIQKIAAYQRLDIIQSSIVKLCGGSTDKLKPITGQTDINNLCHREQLQALRDQTKVTLQGIEEAKAIGQEDRYIDESAALFKKIARSMEGYLAGLYQKAESIIGPAPCKYTVIGLGSMALRQMTPYSDLECAILTENDNYRQSGNQVVRDYFKNLSHLVHFMIISLGETIIPTSIYGLDLSEFIPQAVNFDLGGKTPLGRIDKDKPYELIQSVEGMLHYLKNEDQKSEHIDKCLAAILQKICFVYGDKALADEYQCRAQDFLLSHDENGRPSYEARAIKALWEGVVECDYTKSDSSSKLIEGNLKQFSFNPHELRGRLFDVKQEIYRLPDRLIYNLGLIYGVQEESSWDTLDRLYEQGKISVEGVSNLKKALTFATNLRLKTYDHYGQQKDTMNFVKSYKQEQSGAIGLKQELIEEPYKLSNNDLKEGGALFEYYYIVLPLLDQLENFCKMENISKRDIFFTDELFYQNGARIKALIYSRLREHNKALKYQLIELEKTEANYGKEHRNFAEQLNNLGYTYTELDQHKEALKCYLQAFKLCVKIFGQVHPYVAKCLNNVGCTFRKLSSQCKETEDALKSFLLNSAEESYRPALEIWQKTLGFEHPIVATILDNMGCTYGDLGRDQEALEYYLKALKLRKKVYGEKHLDVTNSLNNIGSTYEDLGYHQKALKYLSQALKLCKEILGEEHPNTLNCKENIAATYKKSGEYDKALAELAGALEIAKRTGQREKVIRFSELMKEFSIHENQYNMATESLAKAEQILAEVGQKSKNAATKAFNKVFSPLTKAFELFAKLTGDHVEEKQLKTLALLVQMHASLNNKKKAQEFDRQYKELTTKIENKKIKIKKIEEYLASKGLLDNELDQESFTPTEKNVSKLQKYTPEVQPTLSASTLLGLNKQLDYIQEGKDGQYLREAFSKQISFDEIYQTSSEAVEVPMKNKAVSEFEQYKLNEFEEWYTPQIVEYLTHLNNQGAFLRYVFFDRHTEDFKNQLESICTIRNSYGTNQKVKGISFISKEPGLGENHFVFGTLMSNKLIIINPIGETGHANFYEALNEFKKVYTKVDIFLSNTVLQQDSKLAVSGLVSCGPICIELMRHISLLPAEKILQCTETGTETSKYGLNYKEVNIATILPDTLSALLNPSSGDNYMTQVIGIRKSHNSILSEYSSLLSLSVDQQNELLDAQCTNHPMQHVVKSHVQDKGIPKTEIIDQYLQQEDKMKNISQKPQQTYKPNKPTKVLSEEANITHEPLNKFPSKLVNSLNIEGGDMASKIFGINQDLPNKQTNNTKEANLAEQKRIFEEKFKAFNEVYQSDSNWLKKAYQHQLFHFVHEGYKLGCKELQGTYKEKLFQEVISKSGKDNDVLAKVFDSIAGLNIKLAEKGIAELKLQYYNDAAVACQYALKVSGDGIQKTVAYQKLDIIQSSIVKLCGGSSDKLKPITGQTDVNDLCHREHLQALRDQTKVTLQEIEEAKAVGQEDRYIDESAALFKKIAGGMKGYLAGLYQKAESIIGPAPCKYAVIGLGSMALRQMTPYSDLECAILTENDNYRQSGNQVVRDYFKNLSHLVHFMAINLGETIIPTSIYGLDLSKFIPQAVNFDLGGKTPLGRIDKDKPYELIQSMEGMLHYLKNEEQKSEHIDKCLAAILQKVCLVYGDKALADEYQSRAQDFLLSHDENGRPNYEARAIKALWEGVAECDYTKADSIPKLIEGNLKQFSFNPYISQGRLFDVKQEIYRLPDRLIYNLGLIYGVQEESSWDTLDRLRELGKISLEGANNLKKALTFATNLRLKTYEHYKQQKDKMDFSKAYSQNRAEGEELIEAISRTFKLKKEDLQPDGALFEYYKAVLPLHDKLVEFCTKKGIENVGGFFVNEVFHSNSPRIIAGIHLRLLQYKAALKQQSLELSELKAKYGEEHLAVAISFGSMGLTYSDLGMPLKALECQKQTLKIRKAVLGEEHPDVANSLNNIGLIYEQLGKHEKALKCHLRALKLFEDFGNKLSDVAASLNNVGTTYGNLGKHQEALKYKLQSLKMWKKLGEEHPDVAIRFNNVGTTYGELGENQKALKYLLHASEISRKTLGAKHPNTLNCKENIAATYAKLGEYDKALAEIAEALETVKETGQREKVIRYSELIKEFSIHENQYNRATESLTKAEQILAGVGQKSKNAARKIFNEAFSPLTKAFESFAKLTGDHVEEKQLKTLKLLVQMYASLNDKKKAQEFEQHYKDLSTKIENKKTKIKEIEEYLVSKGLLDDYLDQELFTQTEESVSKSENLLEKASDTIGLVSYNITADYFDEKDKTADGHHHWKFRSPFVIKLLESVYPDIICLQELSPNQALELHQYFGGKLGYSSVFLSQTPSDIPAGEIAYNEAVGKWCEKNIGTPLIATFISSSYKFLEVNRFWLNESPDEVPGNIDRGKTDKGFGNMNSYRAVLWAKVQVLDEKAFFVFNSHYPLSGGNKARIECARLEMQKIKEITQGAHWASAGDRNVIPSKDDTELCNPATVHNELSKHGQSKESSSKHDGINTTWLGFSYDEHQNQIKGGKFQDDTVLDVIISSLNPVCSFFLHGAFDPAKQELLPLLGTLGDEQNDGRYFASDHALVGVDFVWL
jgi:tetratricopeptide (TPR) repeat protein/endonuclease/exonuclease/phosphatase family metal-dependent hydrolase